MGIISSQNESKAVPFPYNIFWVGTRHCLGLILAANNSHAAGFDMIQFPTQ
jgi:hypothetical protein